MVGKVVSWGTTRGQTLAKSPVRETGKHVLLARVFFNTVFGHMFFGNGL